jgi:uncharacterized protein YfaP (DUF2135 family)
MAGAVLCLAFPTLASGGVEDAVRCQTGRFLIPDVVLLAGPGAPEMDELYIRKVNGIMVASISSGSCPLGEAKMKTRRRFTKVTARFEGCRDVPGRVVVKGKIASPDCDTLEGRMRAPGAYTKRNRRTDFNAVRAPSLVGPDGLAIDSAGGTFTNVTDDAQLTVPPGAFRGTEVATVAVMEVAADDVARIQTLLGVALPAGLTMHESFQVFLGVLDAAPHTSVTSSVADGGASPTGTLIHTLIEPSFVAGMTGARSPALLFDGAVTHSGGRFETRISPQSFGSPPGLSSIVEIPAATPVCFIDGTVRDDNGAPVSGAMVSVSSLPGLEARATDGGFYRSVVTQGVSTVTATSSTAEGSTTVDCNPGLSQRVAGVNVVVEAPGSDVPVVDITDPAADESISATTRTISGTVSDSSIDRVTVLTQSGASPDTFTQTAEVSGGEFSTKVILTPGRENTVIAMATGAQGTGSDSVVIDVTGSAAEDLRFTMTWDTAGTDIDLHVRTPGANGIPDTVDGDTIYFSNSSSGGGTLDVDDTTGFGPENIVFSLGAAQTGTYAVAAHYWNGAPKETEVTVSVFLGGFLIGSFTDVLSQDDPQTPLAGRDADAVFNIATVGYPGGLIGAPADQSVFINGPD